MKHIQEIKITDIDILQRSEKVSELVRIFISDGKPIFLLKTPLWDQPELWGLLIADLISHLGNAYSAEGFNPDDIIGRVLVAFDAERNYPTSEASRAQ
jgi:hypothetical protein